MALRRDVLSLNGRTAVVTGGGGGIGRGIAQGLADFGATVAVWERDRSLAETTAAEIDGLACVIDVRDEAQVDTAIEQTVEHLGVPSILVNNAGGTFHSALLDTALKGWETVIRTNLTQVLLCIRRVTQQMINLGMGGSIINITSIEGVRAAPGFAAYAAAKAGVINFTKTAALELAPYGIRVNGLAPDATLTDALARMASSGFVDEAAQMVPLGRLGHVDEIAGAALFLASDLSSYITGQTLHVDGGTEASGGWYHDSDGRYVLGPAGASSAISRAEGTGS